MKPASTVEVADRVYAYLQPDGSWMLNNAGFVVGEQSVLLVDTCATEHRTRALAAAVTAMSDAPVRTVINTHSHPDHTNGNYLFPQATVVAHEQCRSAMLAPPPPTEGVWTPVDWGALEQRLPDLTYTDRLSLWVDDLEVQIIHPGQTAHTTGDSLIWVPERRVLFAGDLIFNGGTPFALGGSIAGWIEVLDTVVRSLPFDVLVPGHGEPCNLSTVDAVIDYLRLVQSCASEAHAAGLTPLQAARELELGPFAELLDPERLVGNLHRAYAELGVPFNAGDAFADMIEYNGGQPLTCHA